MGGFTHPFLPFVESHAYLTWLRVTGVVILLASLFMVYLLLNLEAPNLK
jgi:hypothetical protein